MSVSSCCVRSFVSAFLQDLGVDQATINRILRGIQAMIDAFNAAQPTQTITSIISQLINCVRGVIQDALTSISITNTSLIIALAVLTVIASTLIALALAFTRGAVTFAIIITTVILFVVGIFIITQVARNRLTSIADDARDRILKCIATAENALSQLATAQEAAIAAAFCAFPPPQ